MKNILDEEIQEGERLFQERYADTGYSRERIRFREGNFVEHSAEM